jgi:transcriptional regulator with XRE-family HTH domain
MSVVWETKQSKTGGENMFDYSKLLGLMKELGFSQEKLARCLNINESTLNRKLNGHSAFTQREIEKICELLNIKNKEIGCYFFAK